VRYASRLLARSPLLTATAILSIGIGANTAIFTAANAHFSRQRPACGESSGL
jgi:hypothetical protein